MVDSVNRPAGGAVERLLAELAENGAIEVVCLAELVHEPHDLVRMAHDVGGEFRGDEQVDRPALYVLEVEHPPDEGLGDDVLRRIPLERHSDELRFVVASAKLLD